MKAQARHIPEPQVTEQINPPAWEIIVAGATVPELHSRSVAQTEAQDALDFSLAASDAGQNAQALRPRSDVEPGSRGHRTRRSCIPKRRKNFLRRIGQRVCSVRFQRFDKRWNARKFADDAFQERVGPGDDRRRDLACAMRETRA